MNEPQIKLGGLSTPLGIIFFGEHFNCSVFERFKLTWKGLKPNGLKVKINKNSGLFSKQWHFFFLFLLADLSIIYKKEIDAVFNSNLPHITLGTNGTALMQNPIIQLIVFVLGLVFLLFLLLTYIFPFWFIYNSRGYHAAEHKTIASVESNDIKNAMNYSQIHERCGTNLIPLYIVFIIVTGIAFIPLPGTSVFASLICLKRIPLLNRISVKIGSYLQLLTTREPNKKEMVNAVRGMTALLKAENVIKTAYQPARYRNAT